MTDPVLRVEAGPSPPKPVLAVRSGNRDPRPSLQLSLASALLTKLFVTSGIALNMILGVVTSRLSPCVLTVLGVLWGTPAEGIQQFCVERAEGGTLKVYVLETAHFKLAHSWVDIIVGRLNEKVWTAGVLPVGEDEAWGNEEFDIMEATEPP